LSINALPLLYNNNLKKGDVNMKKSARKEIYVLLGEHNCGKSSTIKEIYRILSIKYPDGIISNKRKKVGYDMSIKMKIEVKTEAGIEEVLVGIKSNGDRGLFITGSLNDFANNKCNIIFCAESVPNITQFATSSAKNINAFMQNTVVGKLPALKQYKFFPISANLHLKNINPNLQNIVKKKETEAKTNYEVAEKIVKKAGLIK
jgi:ABC-type dipeptide/oligopeptide/nickel transport system ATPase component